MAGNALPSRPIRRHAAVIAVGLLAIGATAVGDVFRASPAFEPAPTSMPSSQPSAPSASPDARWAPLDLAPLQVAATLEPSTRDDAGIPADATFSLASLTGEPARALADRLEVLPPTAVTVAVSADDTIATITPVTALVTGETYRFALRTPDGAVAASWAFRVRGPLNVVSTIPGDATTGVPVRTGIEVTFDQEGVADMADHFSIEPAVVGTFELHGRTQVFVPRELRSATIYTVKISEGLARTGTDLTLPADVVFQFETEGEAPEETRLRFGREVIESGPGEPLDIAIHALRPWQEDGQAPAPTRTDVRIYRLPSLEAAEETLSDFLAAARWTAFSEPVMPTDGLPVVAIFTAPLEPVREGVLLLRVPAQLDEGWYILELTGARRAHAFLQVTAVSGWVSVMSDRTVVWVNDVVTHQALDGATVAVGAANTFATSGVDGLAIGRTPRELLPPAAGGPSGLPSPILRVTSRTGDVVLIPFNVRGDGATYRGEWWETYESADDGYWSVLYTDRGLYRRTDRIETWGYIRGRDDGQVPDRVQLRLVVSGAARTADAPAVVTVEARPGPDGAFMASLPITSVPIGSYEVVAVVEGRVIISRWVEVSVIRKPPYELRLSPDHSAVIVGTEVTWTATAAFFDGTPVASLDLAVSDDYADVPRRMATNGAGEAALTLVSPPSAGESPNRWYVYVTPAGPESAEISASETSLVFPSEYHLAATGRLADGSLTVSGTISRVDLAAVERQRAEGAWDVDPSGAPVVGETIQATITEMVPVRRQIGSEYDFVEKVVRPVYHYDYERKAMDGLSVESGGNGTITFSTVVPNGDHQYEVVLTARDDAGRVQRLTIWASAPSTRFEGTGVAFVTDDGQLGDEALYGIGDRVDWRMADDGRDLPSGGEDRYLYIIAQRGMRAAVVTDTPRFRHTFAAADAPSIFVMGVRFTGTTYAPKAASWATFDKAEREIRVRIGTDRERYRPGESANLTIRTTLPDGSPVAATVVLQAVDEKLYAIGGATIPRPLDDLYRRVDSGIVRLTATHQVPSMSGPEGEGGDTTGGGGEGLRTEFRDTLLFREVRTDAAGQARTSVRLSGDLTSWHVTASAVTADLAAGVAERLVPVGLPFFVEVTVADAYHRSDRPRVRVRAFGTALRAGDRVDFTVESASLGLGATKVRGTAFSPVSVELPALSLGTQSITVAATAPTRKDAAGKPLTDGLTQTFHVVESRLTAVKAAYGEVGTGLPALPDGAEASIWTFTDAGRGRFLPILSELAEPAGSRLDRSLGQSLAAEILIEEFGRDPASLPPAVFDPMAFRVGQEYDNEGLINRVGISLLPYGGVDPWLAARVAVMAPGGFRSEELRAALVTIRDLPTTKRDLRIAALAGLASLGEPVLGDLQEASRQPSLSPTELIYLGLGFEAVGDDASALAIERDLLARYGERLGPWVRLRLDPTDDGADPTATLAVLAAGLGDPLANAMADYAMSNPMPGTVSALEDAAYVTRSLERTPAALTSFAYTVSGQRSVVQLDAGDAFTLQLTATQAATLTVDTLSGQVGAAVEARVPVAPSSLPTHADIKLTREAPGQPIPVDGLVEVNLTAVFAETAPDGCYDVAEFVPSGLAPLAFGRGETGDTGITWPSTVVGQDVRFCAHNNVKTGRTARLRYLARVVNEGTFTWEPAVMQLSSAPDFLAISQAQTATIGGR